MRRLIWLKVSRKHIFKRWIYFSRETWCFCYVHVCVCMRVYAGCTCQATCIGSAMFADQTDFITRWTRVQPVDGKYWTNVSSRYCPRQKSGQFVRVRWRNASTVGAGRDPSRFSDPTRNRPIQTVSSAPDTDSWNINLMARTNIRSRLVLSQISSQKNRRRAKIKSNVSFFLQKSLINWFPFLIWINIKLTYNLLCIFILLKYL